MSQYFKQDEGKGKSKDKDKGVYWNCEKWSSQHRLFQWSPEFLDGSNVVGEVNRTQDLTRVQTEGGTQESAAGMTQGEKQVESRKTEFDEGQVWKFQKRNHLHCIWDWWMQMWIPSHSIDSNDHLISVSWRTSRSCDGWGTWRSLKNPRLLRGMSRSGQKEVIGKIPRTSW